MAARVLSEVIQKLMRKMSQGRLKQKLAASRAKRAAPLNPMTAYKAVRKEQRGGVAKPDTGKGLHTRGARRGKTRPKAQGGTLESRHGVEKQAKLFEDRPMGMQPRAAAQPKPSPGSPEFFLAKRAAAKSRRKTIKKQREVRQAGGKSRTRHPSKKERTRRQDTKPLRHLDKKSLTWDEATQGDQLYVEMGALEDKLHKAKYGARKSKKKRKRKRK